MNVNNVTRWTYILHIPTLNHTCTHMVGTDASFPSIPTISGSFSSETLDRRTRRSTPLTGLQRRLISGFFFHNTCTHMVWPHTYVTDTCKFSTDSDDPVVYIRGNPRWEDPHIYPYTFLRIRADQWTFLFVLVCLVHMYMESRGWGHFTIK